MKAILEYGNTLKQDVQIQIDASKSISNRLLILQAQFPNLSIENLSKSDDTLVLQEGIAQRRGTIDVGHAGTAMRFLTAFFASKEETEVTLTGSARMQQRPIGVLVEALKILGADIKYLKDEGFPPLRIKGRVLRNNKIEIPADISSQYISALMLVAPSLPDGLTIFLEGKTVSTPYLEMTLSIVRELGINATYARNKIQIASTRTIKDKTVKIESDWSSASYFYSLAALSQESKIQLSHFSERSFQGDSALPSIYEILGVQTIFDSSGNKPGKTEGTITLLKKNIQLPHALMLDLSNTPDLAQTLAVSCFGLGIGCRLTGLRTLKIKETDRLEALKNELEKLGAHVQIDDDSLQLERRTQIEKDQVIHTYQDHRMAMAFAPLALKTSLCIENAEVVSKSYPNFWEDLVKIGVQCRLN